MADVAGEQRTDRIRAEQTRILYANAPIALTGGGLSVLLLLGVLAAFHITTPSAAASWGAVVCAVVALHLWVCFRYRRAAVDAQSRLWLRLFTAAALLEGIVTAAITLALPPAVDLGGELVVILVAGGQASAAISLYGAYLGAYLALLLPSLVPHVIFALLGTNANHFELAALVIVYQLVMVLVAWHSNRRLVDGLRLRFENDELLQEVQRQKELAEEANLSKSRFLAAASHDLRQPIHALSLFIAALRPRRMDATARGLVDHIAGSVEATEDLFRSLLDISRLDAGVVEAEVRTFALGPLLTRICADSRIEAEAKGLSLTLRATSASVRSDPVIVERILRNVISNAVRYTDRGGILVACRREGAGRVRVETWDTGRGVPADQQQKVFEEFYQVANPERDRAKGLGLGLAIVHRMARLLDCPISLASRPGRGSVFRITLPLAEGAAAVAEAPDLASLTQGSGLILVVDDDAAVREAMRRLLAGWGHQVAAAASPAETMALADEGLPRPDLIVCDYRLGGGESGLALIEALRAHYGAATPAMLITGDTAPDRLQEARASGLLLLHKPVATSRLRAAIGNLMTPKAPAEA